MLVELSLSKRELARYRHHAERLGLSVEQLIRDAVAAQVAQSDSQAVQLTGKSE
jgi:uncharacterized protein YigA (DUF484 family)